MRDLWEYWLLEFAVVEQIVVGVVVGIIVLAVHETAKKLRDKWDDNK